MKPRPPCDDDYKKALKAAKQYPEVRKLICRQHALQDQLQAAEREKDRVAGLRIVKEAIMNVKQIMDAVDRRIKP